MHVKDMFLEETAILVAIMAWNDEHRAYVIETYLSI